MFNQIPVRHVLLFLALLLLVFARFPSKALAQKSSVVVTPSIRQLDLKEDNPEYFISYQNNTADTVELKLSAADFSELEDGWKINFLDQKDANLYKYSLSSWIELNSQTMVLKPGEKNELKVSIKTDRLPAGGHYGSILAQINTFDLDSTSKKSEISLQGTLSSLLFVRANTGQEVVNADVFSFSPMQNWWNFPEIIILKIRNTGNTFLSPFGKLEIKGPFGNTVSQSILNEGSLIVLPETIRTFQLKQSVKSPFLWPGMYQAEIRYHFGDAQNSKIYKTSFFSLGNMGPVILGVILLLTLLFFQFKKKLHKKH